MIFFYHFIYLFTYREKKDKQTNEQSSLNCNKEMHKSTAIKQWPPGRAGEVRYHHNEIY